MPFRQRLARHLGDPVSEHQHQHQDMHQNMHQNMHQHQPSLSSRPPCLNCTVFMPLPCTCQPGPAPGPEPQPVTAEAEEEDRPRASPCTNTSTLSSASTCTATCTSPYTHTAAPVALADLFTTPSPSPEPAPATLPPARPAPAASSPQDDDDEEEDDVDQAWAEFLLEGRPRHQFVAAPVVGSSSPDTASRDSDFSDDTATLCDSPAPCPAPPNPEDDAATTALPRAASPSPCPPLSPWWLPEFARDETPVASSFSSFSPTVEDLTRTAVTAPLFSQALPPSILLSPSRSPVTHPPELHALDAAAPLGPCCVYPRPEPRSRKKRYRSDDEDDEDDDTEEEGRVAKRSRPLTSGFTRRSARLTKDQSPADQKYLSYYDATLTYEDVRALRSDWLTDNNITFWEEYLEREVLPRYPQAHVSLFRPSFGLMLLNLKTEVARKQLPDLRNVTHIFLPVTDAKDPDKVDGGSHWSLLVVSVIDGVAFHYDSLGAVNVHEAHSVTVRLAHVLERTLSFRNIEDTPQQENGNDCGVFVCILMRFLLVKRLLNVHAGQKVSMSLGGKMIDAAGGRKEMLKIIENLRHEGERRRSTSPFVKREVPRID